MTLGTGLLWLAFAEAIEAEWHIILGVFLVFGAASVLKTAIRTGRTGHYARK